MTLASLRAGFCPVTLRDCVDIRLLSSSAGQCLGVGLADPTRRAVFARLAEQPRPVGELARELPVSRPAVSQHLRVLKEAGLVIDRPLGNRRIYRVDPDGLAGLREQLDEFWSKTLANYKAIVEQSTEEDA